MKKMKTVVGKKGRRSNKNERTQNNKWSVLQR